MKRYFDVQRAYEHIEKLSGWKRLPGTEGEALAQEYIESVGDEMGVKMKREEFSYSSAPLTVFLPLVCLCLSAISFLGALAYLWWGAYTIVPGLILLIVIYLSFKWSGAFESFARRGGNEKSVNLVGDVEGKNSKGLVIVSAHYDSKSQLMPVMVRAGLFILGFTCAILLGIALFIVGILELAGKSYTGMHAGFYLSLLPSIFLALLVFNFTGNKSPGALDDASGVGLSLEIARSIKESPLENYDFRVCSFGCEEMGLCGAINYLLAHEGELKSRRTYMLNLDMPFSPRGRLFLNRGFELPPRYTSRKLNELSKKVAREMGLEIKSIYLPVGAAADHMPWVKHGIEATGFVSAATFIHSSRDSIEKINIDGLKNSGELILGVIEMLDAEGGSNE